MGRTKAKAAVEPEVERVARLLHEAWRSSPRAKAEWKSFGKNPPTWDDTPGKQQDTYRHVARVLLADLRPGGN